MDINEQMLAEARKRAEAAGVAAEFVQGDVHQLPFADNTFDAVRASRLFLYVDVPQALAELVRVIKPGGRIIIAEVEFDTLAISVPDVAAGRKILHYWADKFPNVWVGRHLKGHFMSAGLVDVEAVPVCGTAGFQLLELFGARQIAREVAEKGIVSLSEASAWIEHLEQADRTGTLFAAGMGVVTRGFKAK